jgi:hypothetical protein
MLCSFFTLWLAFLAACTFLGAHFRNAPTCGFWLGFFLGPLGLVLIFFLSDGRHRCPACQSVVDRKAAICPKCQNQLIKPKIVRTLEDEAFCMKCGLDGIKTIEMGEVVATCPQCKQRL